MYVIPFFSCKEISPVLSSFFLKKAKKLKTFLLNDK